MADFYLKAGDRLPKIRNILKDGNGAPINLDGLSVAFRMGLGNGAAPKIDNAPAVVVDGPNGVVEYSWLAGDTDTPGNYMAEWVVTTGGLNFTVPSEGQLVVTISPRA